MEINLYTSCPCSIEKKIKFCCGKDVINDLNQLLSLSDAGQTNAALELVERQSRRLGQRDCLETIRVHLLIGLQRFDEAGAVNDQMLARNPHNAVALGHRAFLLARQRQVHAATSALQDALDAIKGDELPSSLASAFRAVGLALLDQRSITQARRHLRMASTLTGGADERTNAIYLASRRLPGIPPILQHDYELDGGRPEAPWSTGYQGVVLLAARGRWRAALQHLRRLVNDFPGQPTLVRGLAVISSWIESNDEASDAWFTYASLPGLPRREVVEGSALAVALADRHRLPVASAVKLVYPVTDFDEALARMGQRSGHLTAIPVDEEWDDESSARPRAGAALLDPPIPADTSVVPEGRDIPVLIAQCFLFGKETDRPARLELETSRDDRFEFTRQTIEATFAGCLAGPPSEEEGPSLSRLMRVLRGPYYCPTTVAASHRLEWQKRFVEHTFLERSLDVPLELLDGLTLRRAAAEPRFAVWLEGLSELIVGVHEFGYRYKDRLREALGLRPLEAWNPEWVGPRQIREDVSPGRLEGIDASSLTDDQVSILIPVAVAQLNNVAARNLGQELVRRSTTPPLQRAATLVLMSKLEPQLEEALRMIREAQGLMRQENRPTGVLLVDELDLYLSHGSIEEIPPLLNQIERHMTEPEVETRLIHTLERHGLRPSGPPGRPARDGADDELELAPPGGVLDEGEPAAAPASKLWLPDH
jgi:tetratricopeptide (TPR) repeat protein